MGATSVHGSALTWKSSDRTRGYTGARSGITSGHTEARHARSSTRPALMNLPSPAFQFFLSSLLLVLVTRRVAAGCLNSRRPQGSMASDDEVEKVNYGTTKIVEPAAHAASCAFSALGCEEPAQLGVWAQRLANSLGLQRVARTRCLRLYCSTPCLYCLRPDVYGC